MAASSDTDRKRRGAGRAMKLGSASTSYVGETLDIARLAHELRTPLGAIAAMAEVIRDERLGPLSNERYRAYASDIHDGVDHALQVLAAALQQPVADLTASPPADLIRPNDVLAKLTSSLEPLAARDGVKLISNLTASAAQIRIGERALRQIVLNLASNALRFTPPHGTVTVATKVRAGKFVLMITDTGDGMSAANLARARTSSPAARLPRTGAGSRIGISIVRALAEVSGGNLAIESEPGKGTTVTIHWPLSKDDRISDPRQRPR